MKEVRFRAFEIDNSRIDASESDIFEKLRAKLAASESADKRRMQISADDPLNEEDLISYFSHPGEAARCQFCTMLRIAPGKDVHHVNGELFGKPRFSIQELHSTEVDATAVYKSHYYFSVSNKFLVTTLPGNITVRALQTYLNWLLEGLYEITPSIEPKVLPALANIDHVAVHDTNIHARSSLPPEEQTKTAAFDVGRMAMNIIRGALSDTKKLSDEELSQMISAKLIVKFAKPKSGDSEELKKAYSAMLKPVSDLENFSIKTRDRKTVASGKDLLRSRSVRIDTTDSGRLNEKTVEQEMAKFIRDLENESKSGS